jgi:hypothetical protein
MQRPLQIAVALTCLALVSLVVQPSAQAFDYLEHSWFTDAGCRRAQQRLGRHVAANPDDEQLVAKYLALGLMCPAHWTTNYCADGRKQTWAGINRLHAHPSEGGGYAITLGDYAALPDHVSRYGPVRGLPRALPSGLVAHTLEWLADEPTSAGGTIEDVAEDACFDEAPWEVIERDVVLALDRREEIGVWESIPEPLLAPMVRAPIPQGPSDPAAGYSIDNPHYLDLVLRNHTHFGDEAYGAWLGFHSASIATARQTCTDILDIDDDEAEDFADTIAGWEDVEWSDDDPEELRRRACSMFHDRIRSRLRTWALEADADIVAPVREIVARSTFEDPPGALELTQRRRLDQVMTALIGLVLQGAGLHFLQDGLAGGHMRTIRSREALQEVRWDHDDDNAHGVVAITSLANSRIPWVAFGDGRLLGPPLTEERSCDFAVLASDDSPDPALVSTCLIQNQRGMLVGMTEASLVDWALGGTLFGERGRLAAERGCDELPELERLPCQALPVGASVVSGNQAATVFDGMHHGSLPVPPPPFSFESISMRLGYEFAAPVTQFGLRMSFLADIDIPAHWLRSYNVGVSTTFGDGIDNQWLLDFSYAFHFRWWARAMFDLSPTVYTGLRGFDGDETAFFAGIAPTVGFTVLPEGWVKAPLEIGIHYRLPLTVFGTDQGFFGDDFVDGHWILLGVGLAFMH